MPILLFLLMLNGTQPIVGPVTDCPVVVEVVDPVWALMPGVDVTVRDERTQRTQTAATNTSGTVQFTLQSCADDRCRFTISAAIGGFKTVTMKRLWFGQHQAGQRHVQIRLADVKGRTMFIR